MSISMAPPIIHTFLDANGDPLAGGKLYTYQAGTVTNKTTYQDAAGAVANANPIILDSAGRVRLFLESGAYKFVVHNSNDVQQWPPIDNIVAGTSADTVDDITDIRDIVPGSLSFVRTRGRITDNDGGGWWYFWDAASTAADDGGMVIRPSTLPAAGRWVGIIPHDRQLNLRIYGAVLDGVTSDLAALQACDTWCAANDCTILVDGNLHFTTDPTLTSKIKLLPGVVVSFGSITPVLDVVIDGNDKTQHFNCTASYYPILNVSELYPEWFGETNALHPITNVVLNNLSEQKTRHVADAVFRTSASTAAGVDFSVGGNLDAYSAEIATDLLVSNTTRMNSTLAVNLAPADALARVDISYGDRTLCLGANAGTSTARSVNTEKGFSVISPGYSGSGAPVGLFNGNNASTSSVLRIGRGDSSSYAVTEVSFYTAANNTTLAGTRRGYFGEGGGLVVGAPTGGDKGAGTVNAEAVYDDNVLLTGYALDKAYNPEYSEKEWDKKATNGVHEQAREFCTRAGLMLDLDEYCDFIESRRMLPTFEDVESTGNIPSTGVVIQKLWEVVEIQAVHIKQLNDRLKKLEG